MSYHQEDNLEYGYRKKTFKSYAVGLVGSLILTFLAFGAVYLKCCEDKIIYILISVFATLQLIIQCICFLRLNATPSGYWNLFPFLFVLMIILFIVGGSFWIMHNLNYNMI
jgi:cytochrome o ubiquinol oxidase operon protein cyoD